MLVVTWTEAILTSASTKPRRSMRSPWIRCEQTTRYTAATTTATSRHYHSHIAALPQPHRGTTTATSRHYHSHIGTQHIGHYTTGRHQTAHRGAKQHIVARTTHRAPYSTSIGIQRHASPTCTTQPLSHASRCMMPLSSSVQHTSHQRHISYNRPAYSILAGIRHISYNAPLAGPADRALWESG